LRTLDLTSTDQQDVTDALLVNMRFYKGSGSPVLYTTLPVLTWLLLARDGMQRRLYRTASDLASEIGVSRIETVEVMEDEENLIGIVVNLKDYTIGADKWRRCRVLRRLRHRLQPVQVPAGDPGLSGALTKIRSALVIRKADVGAVEVVPAAPEFDGTDITIVNETGVVYRRG
jgi:hypothetical protein